MVVNVYVFQARGIGVNLGSHHEVRRKKADSHVWEGKCWAKYLNLRRGM